MISTYFGGIQSSIMTQNMLEARMMNTSSAMLSALNFGASQPLKPQFGLASDVFELQNKADETKLYASRKLMESMEKALAKSISRSTPKFGGLDYKA